MTDAVSIVIWPDNNKFDIISLEKDSEGDPGRTTRQYQSSSQFFRCALP